MSEPGQTDRPKPNYAVEQIKALRARRRKDDPAKVAANKRGKEIQKLILTSIAEEARTVPEIAADTGLSAQEVLWWVTALRKYGQIQDEGKRGDYVAYRRK